MTISGYRLSAGHIDADKLTATYAIENWPRQNDQAPGRDWVRPGNEADVVMDSEETVTSLSGLRGGYGRPNFTWVFTGLTPLQVQFILDTFFAALSYSGLVTARTFSRKSGQWEYYQATAQRGTIKESTSPVGGGYTLTIDCVLGTQIYVQLLYDQFSVDEAAPITSPRTAGQGTWTIVDTGNDLSVSSGSLICAGTNNDYSDPALWTSQMPREAGTMFCYTFQITSGSGDMKIGIDQNQTGVLESGILISSLAVKPIINTSTLSTGIATLTAATDAKLTVVLREAGEFIFLDGNLLFVSNWGEQVAYGVVQTYDETYKMTEAEVRVLPWPMTAEYDIASLNLTAHITDADYVASDVRDLSPGDALFYLTYTLPGGPISGDKVELYFRKQDANNHWLAYVTYTGSQWDFKLDSVVSGTPTNRINATAVGSTDTIIIRCEGSKHYAYTATSGTVTQRGAEIDVSYLEAETSVSVSATNVTPTQLTAYPIQSSAYARVPSG